MTGQEVPQGERKTNADQKMVKSLRNSEGWRLTSPMLQKVPELPLKISIAMAAKLTAQHISRLGRWGSDPALWKH